MHTRLIGVVSSVFLSFLIMSGCSPSNETADDPAFSAANGIKGGIMYDEFWAEEIGFNQANTAHFDQYPNFFRCVQCHGWDLLGRAGGFALYSPSTSAPNIANLDLYEAAKVDGASVVQEFRYITIPNMRRMLFIAAAIDTIWQFRRFGLVFNMTLGGPGNATEILSLYVYKQYFRYFNFEYASAIAVVLALIMLLLSWPYVRAMVRRL